MEVPLLIDDKTLTIISTIMEIGIAAAEDFNEIDHNEWSTSPKMVREAKRIVHDLDAAVIYDYIIQSMGAE